MFQNAQNIPAEANADRKLQLLHEALQNITYDDISGYKLSPSSELTMRDHSLEGEKILITDLKRSLALTSEDFTTEDEMMAALAEGESRPLTPDVLFKTPQMICGKLCHWVEAKHSVAVPGISPDRFIADIKKQTDKYVATFGPGVILWTKCGFCDRIKAALSPEIVHAVPSKVFLQMSKQAHRNHAHHDPSFFQNQNPIPAPHMHTVHSFPHSEPIFHGLGGLFPGTHRARPMFMYGPGTLLGGDDTLNLQTARMQLLNRVDQQLTAARLLPTVGTSREEGEGKDDDEEAENSFTVMLVRMFASAEDESEALLARLGVFVRLLRLSDSGIKAMAMVGKILQKIMDNPADER